MENEKIKKEKFDSLVIKLMDTLSESDKGVTLSQWNSQIAPILREMKKLITN